MGNVLIVGASGDIGAAISLRLAEEGHRLLLHYHQGKEKVEQLIATLPNESVLKVLHANLQEEEGMNSLVNQIDLAVDSVIFASGMSHFGMFQNSSLEEMDQMLNLHIKAPWRITKRLLPEMVQRKSGHIIMISSIWGRSWS
ncbi:SDR family NAD(P)-dependent oxidoreductase [Radiobacillus deserti]|uniref:SDR family NAD(P)-dependent oxidoreductase n=1 Tax=Radiobacillus deserti TaxID=2594883 RepID=UPI002B21005A|nr:SDR family NAD(P)-dependent oxidoreductase [Radiobacillus deserti]